MMELHHEGRVRYWLGTFLEGDCLRTQISPSHSASGEEEANPNKLRRGGDACLRCFVIMAGMASGSTMGMADGGGGGGTGSAGVCDLWGLFRADGGPHRFRFPGLGKIELLHHGGKA